MITLIEILLYPMLKLITEYNTIHLHSDITCGKEKLPIPCINEVDDVAAPLDFVYVKESFESSYLCINRNMNTIKVGRS